MRHLRENPTSVEGFPSGVFPFLGLGFPGITVSRYPGMCVGGLGHPEEAAA